MDYKYYGHIVVTSAGIWLFPSTKKKTIDFYISFLITHGQCVALLHYFVECTYEYKYVHTSIKNVTRFCSSLPGNPSGINTKATVVVPQVASMQMRVVVS